MGKVTVTVIGSVILLLLGSKFGKTATEVSKACYGAQGLPCTSHNLRCSNGSITIQEAFYMNSTVCPQFGTSVCYGINLTSIPLTGSRFNFSVTELGLLHGNCSTKPTCSFVAGRRSYDLVLSLIKYHCLNETTQTVATETTACTLSTGTTGSIEVFPPNQAEETTYRMVGMFGAGLFTGFGIAAVIAGIVYFLYIRQRCVIKKPDPDPDPSSLTHPTYSGLTGPGCPDTYDVIDRQEGLTNTSEQSQASDYQNVDGAS